MFSLESPHRGDSNTYTQYTSFNTRKENQPKFSQIYSYVVFSKGLKNEFHTAVVNEPSVFEPLKRLMLSVMAFQDFGVGIAERVSKKLSVRCWHIQKIKGSFYRFIKNSSSCPLFKFK